jgi:succinyl-CoA synthetase alpha subunit
MPAFESNIFRPGPIGVVSRSGSLGTLVCLEIVRAGQAGFLGLGGDPIIGTTTREAVELLDADERVEAVVIAGGRGTGVAKVGALREAGAHVLDTPSELSAVLSEAVAHGRLARRRRQ